MRFTESIALHEQPANWLQDVFEDPAFFLEGATANDVRQGNDGDCWFMSALCTLSNKEGLIEKVCVARDEQVGVYGFVFHRGKSSSFVRPEQRSGVHFR